MNREKRLEYYQSLLNEFKSTALEEFIETGHSFLNSAYFGSPHTRKHTSLEFCACNSHYKSSSYYYDKSRSLIHFTSVDKLEAILKSRTLRLYNLVLQNDPEELSYGSKFLRLSQHDVQIYQKNSFILAMCELDKLDDLIMWRLYGDGTKGAAIILEFDDLDYWRSFHLSKVYYKEHEKLQNYWKNKIRIEKKYDFSFRLSLGRFLGFYKSPVFEAENEIRLLYYFKQLKGLIGMRFNSRDHVKADENNREFVEIELGNKSSDQSSFMNWGTGLPKPKISKIVTGPCFTEKERLSTLLLDYPEVQLEESELKGKFRV